MWMGLGARSWGCKVEGTRGWGFGDGGRGWEHRVGGARLGVSGLGHEIGGAVLGGEVVARG